MAAELSQSVPPPYVCTSAIQEKQQEAQQSQGTQQQPSTQQWAAYSPQDGKVYPAQPSITATATAPVQYVTVS